MIPEFSEIAANYKTVTVLDLGRLECRASCMHTVIFLNALATYYIP